MIALSAALRAVFERGGTLVVPTRARAHSIRLAHAAAEIASGRRAWASPDVLPLESWLAREIERHAASSTASMPRLLAKAEEWLLWREATQDCLGAREILDVGALAEALRGASALAASLGIDAARLGDAHGSEPALLGAAQRAFDGRCRDLGAASAAALLASVPSLGDSRPVLFAGWSVTTPQIEALVRARVAFGFESAGTLAGSGDGRVATPRLRTMTDEIAELEAIAEWCHERLAADPDTRLLVLVPGSAGRRQRLATLIGQAFDPLGWLELPHAADPAPPAIIEGAGPLGSMPEVAEALSALRLLAGARLEFELLSQWLRSPCCGVAPPAERARIDLLLRERGAIRLELGQLLAQLRTAEPGSGGARAMAEQLERAARALSPRRASPREWSEHFRAALGALGWPGDGRSSAEQQIVLRFSELLDELGQLSLAAHSLARDTAVAWLAELAARTAFRPADADAPVTIAAALIDPVVRYDGLWVAGLEADVLPEATAPNPFLPLAAQRAAAHPAASAAGRLGEARALLASWRRSADELVLSAPRRRGDLEVLPSPLLEEWPEPAPRPQAARQRSWLPVRIARSGLLESRSDDRGSAWALEQPLPAGTRSLELQNQCPFRAYAQLRLGAEALGAPEPGIAADFRGRLLHAALERFWAALTDSAALAALGPSELDVRIERSVAHAAARLLGGASDALRAPPMVRECARAVRLVRTLCELERTRTPFRVEHTERTLPLALAGTALTVRIDRIDALEAGGRAILDYKSGPPAPPDWYGERPSHPQLLAYLAALGADVVALATVSVGAREVKFEGVAASAGLLPRVSAVKPLAGSTPSGAWPARIGAWRGLIERLARDFAAGAAEVDPRPDACRHCHIAPVCRIGDDGTAAEPQEEAGDV